MKRSTQKVIYRNKKTGKVKYYYYHKNSDGSRNVITGREHVQLRLFESKFIVNGKVKFNAEFYTKSLNLSDRNAFNAMVNSLIRKEGKSYTLAQVKAMVSGNKAVIAMANSGLSVQQLAEKLKTSEKTLLDGTNWHGAYFTDPDTGTTYQFRYNYEGESSFEEVKADNNGDNDNGKQRQITL